MTIHSHLLPRPSTSSPVDNRAHTMVNNNQAPDLKGFPREMHGITEQIKIINENNALLIQHLATNNPLPLAVPIPLEVERSCCSHRSGDRESQSRHNTVHQNKGESLKDYVKRFNQAVLEVEGTSDKIVVMAMMEGLRPGPLFDSLSKSVPETQLALQSKADEYIAVEDLAEAKHKRRGKEDYKRKKPDSRFADYQDMEQIADLIKKGYLKKYVADCPCPNSLERRYGDNRSMAGDIQVIYGGFRSKGCSSSSRKRYVREASGRAKEVVYNLSSPLAIAHQSITFTNDDLRGLHLFHDNVLIRRDKHHYFHTLLIIFGGNTTYPVGSPNTGQSQGHHFDLSPDDEIFHFNRDRRDLEPEITLPEVETIKEQNPDEGLAKWKLFVDGLSNQHGCGTGFVLQTPSGKQIEYAIRIGFKATNSEATYEALLSRLRAATELGVDALNVFSESQLMVNQIQGDYLSKDARMVAYLDEVKTMTTKIQNF
ncbi:hypothetical protein Acr_00g0056410 [Actinidia rufa]|uniref:RNase H type-1 domain-containing protein n=1 Tax=Actinidia rufa TaxID=165716 RepID=A0A7J0DM67_9ERIC|nr:hypothetical protein Acr_00g0056410 [Actinidia rufa]